MKRFEGKVVVVTGAAQGIGEVIAQKFLENGATVLVAGRTLSKVEAAVEKMASDKAIAFQMDVGEAEGWKKLIAYVQANYPDGLDAIINNAAVTNGISQTILDATDEDWDRIMKTNLYGAFYCLKYGREVLKKGVYAGVVQIGSFAGLSLNKGTGGDIAYQTSKYAIRHLYKGAALSLAPECIRVNIVHPGGSMTPMLQAYLDGIGGDPKEILAGNNPLPPHYVRPEELAEACMFLADPVTGRAITGAELAVDSAASLV